MPKRKRQPGIHLHNAGKNVYYWILISKNGRTIAKSSETYKRKGSAVRSIAIAAKVFANAVGMFGGYYIDHTRKEIKTDYYDHF